MTTETELETPTDLPSPGTYYERNYFPEDIDFLNKATGGARVVFIDNPTPKALEAAIAIQPLDDELTHDRLIKRVNKLHRNDWILLMASYDSATAWRQLLGRALYKQMEHFRLFFGVTLREQRNVHFFMMKKTPQFKRNIRKFKNVNKPWDTETIARLFCIADHPAADPSDMNVDFMGSATSEIRAENINAILTSILE